MAFHYGYLAAFIAVKQTGVLIFRFKRNAFGGHSVLIRHTVYFDGRILCYRSVQAWLGVIMLAQCDARFIQRILHIAAAHFCGVAFSVGLQHKRECILQADIFNLVGICRIIADVALRNLYSGFLQQLIIVLFMAYKSHGAAAGICDIYRAQPLRGRQHHKR